MTSEIPDQLKKAGVRAEMIRRVPRRTRRLHEDAYAPQLVSFGLYPSNSVSYDNYKWCFLEEILNMNTGVSLEKYLKELDGMKQEVRDSYASEYFYWENNERLIKMLLLDGCCILGFLGILPLSLPQSIIILWHQDSIRHDLLLLENQLPFVVLQKIYDLAIEGISVAESLTLIQRVDRKIKELLKSYPLITNGQNFGHLLHCCHLKFKPAMNNNTSSNSRSKDELQRKWHGATDLYKSGIKFKPKLCESYEYSLLDVKFSGRTLMVPTLKIEDSTSSVFRNLIAFEQSCTRENYFVAYAFFMGKLMGTPEDVTLLVKQGVVENYIGANKEVSDFFNDLVKGVIFNVDGEHFLSSTFKDLNSYYNNKGHKFLADLKQNYCGSPWLAISVVVAAVILVCTVVQAVFAVIK